MSIPRSAIAYTLDIPEERVRCKNCICSEELTDGHRCKVWNKKADADDFCTFFDDREIVDNL